ncbi:MAG: amidohydrolase family protein [Clostridia bacterium]|nr:amidohydrolase family protein [Clostridia bacterium]
MLAIKNVTLVMPDYLIEGGSVLCENGKISAFGKEIKIPKKAKVVNGKGLYLAPGFVDIHTHAGGKFWFYEEPLKAGGALLKAGVTTVLPTLYPKFGKKELVEKVLLIKEAVKTGKFYNFGGFYIEGPYLNPDFGSSDPNGVTGNLWSGKISEEDYMPLIEACGTMTRVWCFAPERDGLIPFVEAAKKANPEAVFAVAHSKAEPEDIEKFIPYGLCIGTHHLNATGTLQKYPECRTPCVDETVFYNNQIYAEIISDSMGIHVDPYIQRLTRKIKGVDKIILISDACTYDFTPPEHLAHITDLCIDSLGEIQGSRLTLPQAAKNWRVHTGAGLPEIFTLAARNPARAVGLLDRGEIRKGLRADLVLLDEKFNIKKVFLEGKEV